MQKLIKELQNLYSWNQFHQENKNKESMKKAQKQITLKKQEIDDFKAAKSNRNRGKR